MPNKVSRDKLLTFLADATIYGYATHRDQHESDRSKSIVYQAKDFKYDDNYFGGDPHGGRTIVFYKNKPELLILIHGTVAEGEKETAVKSFLVKALRSKTSRKEFSLRGPRIFNEGDLTYTNKLKGGIDRFSGEEAIYRKGRKIYEARYIGGLVDQ